MEGNFKEIKGFKRVSYLPRLGKIRLGEKVVSQKTGKEYPREVAYFICPPEVQKVYGEKPVALDIMFPSEDPQVVIPYCYKRYGANQKLKCKGNGQEAVYFGGKTRELQERACPCEHLGVDCDKRGHLLVILPRVSLGGVYQIDTGSSLNINRILNVMEYWKMMVGRCKCIPLVLERVREKIRDPNGMMQDHYFFRFNCNLKAENLNAIIQKQNLFISSDFKIEPPKEDGVLEDTPVAYEDEENIDEEAIKDDGFDITEGMTGTEEVIFNGVANNAIQTTIPFTSPPSQKTPINYKFLKVMRELKKKVGKERYYQILKLFGYEHSNEITDRKTQEKIYKQLLDLVNYDISFEEEMKKEDDLLMMEKTREIRRLKESLQLRNDQFYNLCKNLNHITAEQILDPSFIPQTANERIDVERLLFQLQRLQFQEDKNWEMKENGRL